jgi:hypothetical protein
VFRAGVDVIVSLDDAKARLNLTTSRDDVELMMFIEAIAAPVEKFLYEIVDQRDFSEDLELCGQRRFWLTNTPVISLVSAVSLDGSRTYDVASLRVNSNGRVRVVTGPAPHGVITFTYTAGYAVVPPNVREGALVILQHVWETQRGPGGVLSGVVGAEELRKTLSAFTVPAKAREWLGEPSTLMA